MIERILPPWVLAAETFGDLPDARVFSEERSAVAGAVDKRVREFATARACAREALRRLGMPTQAIPVGENGAPRWPPGVTGSITHCADYRAAAVSVHALAVGIDAEPHEELPPEVLSTVLTRSELEHRGGGVHWGRVVFSAKEAIYKAWHPLTGRWLDFTDVVVSLSPSGTFMGRVLLPGPTVGGKELREIPGRWLVADGIVTTAVALARR